MNINYKVACLLAQEKLKELQLSVGMQLQIMEERTEEVEKGWLFFYNTSEYICFGESANALAGNGPIFISRNGEVMELPSGIPWRL